MCDEEGLIDVLDDISDDEFTTFKWHLKKETWKGIDPIKTTKLQRAQRLDVVDLMVQKYQLNGAMMVMMNVFKKINRNDLVKKLMDLSPEAEDPGPASSSNSSDNSVDKLTSVRGQFVNKVSAAVLQQLLDRMLEEKVLTDCEMEFGNINKGDKARSVVDMVRNKGSKASSALITALCEVDPCLAEELKLK
ncbi:hypothetical protein XENOCAPTIV_021457 [Xenoophorus captivus]|uniref:CARD domain-containing protein n=1 Tax=Xenoophorus captivus TaxID=1517983 RepID=A0ABV0SIW9_9TELE